MCSWKEAWLEKVVLMDVGIQLRQVVCRYLVQLLMRENAISSIVCFLRIATIWAKQIFIFYSKVINLRLTNAEYILVSSCYGT